MPITLNPFTDVTFSREVEGSWKLEAGPLSLEQIAAKQVRAALGVQQEFIFKFQTHSQLMRSTNNMLTKKKRSLMNINVKIKLNN